jgi:hypothetical protein
MTQAFTTSAKPVTYYVDSPIVRQLCEVFGDYLQSLPKYEKFNILMVVGAIGHHDTDPTFEQYWGDYNVPAACEDHAIFIDWYEEYPIPLKPILDQMSADELLALCEFLTIDLRTTQSIDQ